MARVTPSVIGIIIMVLVLIASAGGYMYNTKTQSQNKAEISSLQLQLQTLQAEETCLMSTPVPQRPTGNLTPVLLMKPNTTGAICVTYETSWGGDSAAYTNYTASLASNHTFGISIAKNNSVSHAFAISMQPSSVMPSASMKSITVLYQVNALANSTGFYAYSAPYEHCDTMPMAVGYSASQVNGSDFPSRPPPHSCPATPYSPASVGVIGINVTLVDIPIGRSYMAAPTETSFCTETSPHYSGTIPCFTYQRSEAYMFNCTAAAATSSGCTRTLGTGATTFNAFNVTVWYPAKNQTLPWANCYYVVSNASGKTPVGWAVCIAITSDSFIIATPSEALS